MARIRTVKPEFWTDERLTECSLSARLMFIGMLNFADDNGNLVKSPKRLKMQIFPADMIDTAPLLAELLTHGLVIEYSVSGTEYLHIKGFRKHQIINRPSKTDIPQPPIIEDSVSTHVPLTDGREGKGEEGSKEEANASLSTSPEDDTGGADVDPPAELPMCPHGELLDLWAKHCPTLTQPRRSLWPNSAGADALRARWRWVLTAKEDGKRLATTEAEALEWFARFFAYVAQCPLLIGLGSRGWQADLSWVVKAENFAKVMQGNYENREAA